MSTLDNIHVVLERINQARNNLLKDGRRCYAVLDIAAAYDLLDREVLQKIMMSDSRNI
jgi:hypothetical protein